MTGAAFTFDWSWSTFFYGLFALWLILRLKLSAKFRDWAGRVSSRRFLQACVFAPLLLVTLAVLTLPSDIYGQLVEKQFGISIQGWGSWAGDWAIEQVVSLILAIIFVWILYAVIRKNARRWWFYFWLASLPLVVLVTLMTPWVIDPLFHKFEPLQSRDPALVMALEQMMKRAGVDIPPERMFWMNAGENDSPQCLRHRHRSVQAHRRMGHDDRKVEHAANRVYDRPRNRPLRFATPAQGHRGRCRTFSSVCSISAIFWPGGSWHVGAEAGDP